MRENMKMEPVVVVVVGFLFSVSSASTYISDDNFGSRTSTIRNLLQAEKDCPVSFEFLNYTILTSRCKGPEYPPELCCPAFKELVCPYAAEFNDLTTNCNQIMFSYINSHGNLTRDLFATQCQEGKLGLDCPASPPTALDNARGTRILCNQFGLFMVTIAVLVSLLI